MNTLLILVGILTFACLCVYFGNKKIAAHVYEKTVAAYYASDPNYDSSKESPYRIERIYSTYSDKYFYYIFKGKEKVDSSSYKSVKEAQVSLNELEKLGNFKLTKIV